MPSAACHSFYWAGSADAPVSPTNADTNPYLRWMTVINVHSVSGSLGANVFQAIYEQWRPSRTTTQVRHGDH